MLETQLYFNFKDMFRVPRLALGRRTLVMLEALLVAYVVHLSMAYAASLVEGNSFGSIWNHFHLMPTCVSCLITTTIGKFFIALSYIFTVITIALAATAVAKITIKEYKGNLFYSSKDGWKWAFKNWFPVFFGPISIAITIGFFVVLAGILGWLAQWPVLDILLYGFLFVIFLPTALFLVFSILALATGLFMSPSIVACAEEDTMGSMFSSYTLLWNQPVRLITYTVIITALAFFGYHIFYLFILSAFKLIRMIFGHELIMGDAFIAIKQVGLDLFGNFNFLPSYYEIPACLTPACIPEACCGGCGSAPIISTTFTQAVSGVLVAFVSLAAYLAIPAYALSTLATGFATSFIVLTKNKDDQDLIARKDADDRAEEEAERETEDEEKANTEESQEEKK
ncbi:MAG: hypothetical protein K9N35_08890 [Candidatus Marinimicrobia bacterium]|nr:hypothetical protein [Candidatus Neomarinimicrobiota bacterium]